MTYSLSLKGKSIALEICLDRSSFIICMISTISIPMIFVLTFEVVLKVIFQTSFSFPSIFAGSAVIMFCKFMGGLNIASLGQLTRDMFRAINVYVVSSFV